MLDFFNTIGRLLKTPTKLGHPYAMQWHLLHHSLENLQ